jgi:hypothetical protein
MRNLPKEAEVAISPPVNRHSVSRYKVLYIKP